MHCFLALVITMFPSFVEGTGLRKIHSEIFEGIYDFNSVSIQFKSKIIQDPESKIMTFVFR